jgi:protein-tyrosine phosphatase
VSASFVRRVGRLLVSASERDNARHEWKRRRQGEPELPADPVERILVVCHGNICRSPFAEGLLASRHPMRRVRSAGLQANAGCPSEPAARRAAARFGVDLGSHAARALEADDVAWADLILGMEGHHAVRLARLWPPAAARTRLLGDFLPSPPFTIHDPWGRDDEFFDRVFERIAVAAEQLSTRLAARGVECSGGP